MSHNIGRVYQSEDDIEIIRQRLIDYYGTAMQIHPMAVIDLAHIDAMTDDEVLKEAQNAGII